jgi:anti-sigma factor RsiW
MNCDRFAQVHAYHDDALAPSDRVALEAHLGDCADCRELLDELSGLSRLITSAPLVAMSPAARARLSQSWRAARDRGLLRISSYLSGAAAAVLVGALFLWPDRNGGAGPTVATASAAPVWETAVVMPPADTEENAPEVVLAQWMANDLSYAGGDRQ